MIHWMLLPVLLAAAPATALATADDPTAAISDLDRRALEAYEDLDFDKARALLQEALKAVDAAAMGANPVAARTHLYLGMVLLGGFALRDAASAEFKAALAIQPDVAPPRGRFNPEGQSLFEQLRGEKPAPAAAAPPTTKPRESARPIKKAVKAQADAAIVREDAREDEEEEDDDDGDDLAERSVLIAVALGTGGGTATGHLDMGGVEPNRAAGRFALSETVHTTIALGYFLSRSTLLSVEARLQLGTNATPHCTSTTSCADTSDFAFAGLAKVTHYFGYGTLQPFVLLGAGGGRIRQRVELTGLPDCGRNSDRQCYDTVAGGPIFVAGGGGLSYQAGQFLIQAAVTANVGFPSFMLNVDATLGVGLLL